MKQLDAGRWMIFSEKGEPLTGSLVYGSNDPRVEEYVKAYISSWHDWSYVIEPLEEK